MTDAEFDSYASAYDDALTKGIAVSGEDKTYFAEHRLRWLARSLRERGCRPKRVLDFGCGTGTATPFFFKILEVESFVGLDVSEKSLAIARATHGSSQVRFESCEHYCGVAEFDLAFCNGVFHHLPLEERPTALRQIHESLRPGGLFALCENNPLNPGTRYVMSRIPFDRDAIVVPASEARRIVKAAGFDVLRIDFLFIFPALLKWFRRFEPALSALPLGAQYQLLARKPL